MLIRCLVLSQEHFMSDRFYSGETTISCVAVRLINSCVQMFAIILKFHILLLMCLMISSLDNRLCYWFLQAWHPHQQLGTDDLSALQAH